MEKQPAAALAREKGSEAELNNDSMPSIVVQVLTPAETTGDAEHAGEGSSKDDRVQSKSPLGKEPPSPLPHINAEIDSHLELLSKIPSCGISLRDLQRILAQRAEKEPISSAPAAEAKQPSQETTRSRIH